MSLCILDLYLPADTPPNVAAGKAVVSDLCRHATINDLCILLTEVWMTDEHLATWDDWTDATLAARASVLRETAASALHRLLDAFAASLRGPHVARFRLDADTGASVDVYLDGPTDAVHPWSIVCCHNLLSRGGPSASARPAGCCTRAGPARPSPRSPSTPSPRPPPATATGRSRDARTPGDGTASRAGQRTGAPHAARVPRPARRPPAPRRTCQRAGVDNRPAG